MLVLNEVFLQRRTSTEDATALIQKPASEARRVLERLTERGWLEAKGEKKGRVYHFTSAIYHRLGQPAAYVRSKGISAARHEALVEEYVRAHRRVTRPAVLELCGLTEREGSYLLAKMVAAGKLKKHGVGRWTHYTLRNGGSS